ncbi:MAG: GNAT family N-acetyltransferase [Rhodospirillales bacterium]|nr:GNAT family N-acetyltransferase [Rhodospirillales bacterium]
MTIAYAIEPGLSVEEFIDVLRRSTLAERRPVDDRVRIAKMLNHAGLIVTARDGLGSLVGVARAVTDFSYCCYLSDLAVDQAFQGRGIGLALMKRVRAEAGEQAMFLLLSAPGAMTYYPQAGLSPFDNCFGLRGPWPET